MLVALLLLSCKCLVAVYVLWFFLTVPCVGLQCVIVVFPDHTHLHFDSARMATKERGLSLMEALTPC